MSKKTIIPYGAIRFCIGTLFVLAFLTALFCAGLAIYADRTGITFVQAWDKLWSIGNPVTQQAISDITKHFA